LLLKKGKAGSKDIGGDSLAVRLCRCGQSNDKPFCDGSHRPAEFKADGRGA
jgi:CDGSH-type Zn-finger protein